MSSAPELLFLAGSARRDSYNKKLARIACDMATDQGAKTTLIDLRDYPMPIYDGDLEEEGGLPEAAKALKSVFVAHAGFFIAAPEYNSSIAPLLKNALDWISRRHENKEPALLAYTGKVAAISAASPGGFGGLRGLVPLRMMLSNIGVTVIPEQLAVARAMDAFDAAGNLTDKSSQAALSKVVTGLIRTTSALA